MRTYKKHLIFVFALLLSTGAAGQEHAFAFALNEAGRASLKPAAQYKYDIAKKVFDDLLLARGDLRQQPPALIMTDGSQFIAWMDPDAVHIGIEELAYDVCRSFGADSLNALAVLMAHELTHYYEKHDWSRNFAHGNKGLAAAEHVHNLDEGLKQEIQADHIGGFLAFSAGYNSYNLMPELLPALYKAYGLPEELRGYPSLPERIQLSLNAMKQLRELQTVFETAGFLVMLGRYESAATYYQRILEDYQSREVYNNAGVNYALAALSYFSKSEMPYVLPLELDQNSRLHNLKTAQAERVRQRQALLGRAQQQFDRVLSLDPNYALGYLNKASVHALAGEWEDAEFWCRKGKRLNDEAHTADFIMLEGIIAAMQADKDKAQQLFEVAKAAGSSLAGLNLQIDQEARRETSGYEPGPSQEVIDGTSLATFMAAPSVDKEVPLLKNSKAVLCGAKVLPHSRIWLHYAKDGKEYAVVHWCDEDSTAKSQKGIYSGSAAEEVTAAYGAPQRIVAHPEGAVWVYATHSLLFLIDSADTVKSWGAYAQSEELR